MTTAEPLPSEPRPASQQFGFGFGERQPPQCSRAWAMPSADTFSIPPIKQLVARCMVGDKWLDPFSRHSPFAGRCVTNDLNKSCRADYHMEALDFLNLFEPSSFDGVLFDPPYSPRQISEVYSRIGRHPTMHDTQSSFWADRKDAAARLIRVGGIAMCFGWNSNGFGMKRGFDLVEVLVVAHGGAHKDTICTVEVKRRA